MKGMYKLLSTRMRETKKHWSPLIFFEKPKSFLVIVEVFLIVLIMAYIIKLITKFEVRFFQFHDQN